MTSSAPETFPDKPAAIPGETVREALIRDHKWFQSLTPERQEAFRQKVRDDNNEE